MGGAATRVVLHADDLGMSHGANAAFAELCAFGTITCGSVMAPCPWFAELAAMARDDPSLDVGVHLTLTSEMKGYRWRPLTRPPGAAGLTDGDGFFHPDVATVRARAGREAVEAELRAQIEAALGAGIDVTHLDDHMGAVLAPEFVATYVRVAADYRLPLVMCPALAAYGGPHNLRGVTEATFAPGVALARAAGFAIFDRIAETAWQVAVPPADAGRAMIESLAPGLTFLALHVTRPGEIEAIDAGFHAVRTGEYALFRSAAFRDWLHARGLELVGMRALRDELRARTNTEKGAGWTVSASA
jgi:predicted glycoside hydrolase/deacetylase ChbG (UPF0249 family)